MSNKEADKVYFFRPFTPDDLNFVSNSWGSSYYKGANYHKHFSPDEFHAHHRPIRDRFFKNDCGAIIVCCSKEDPNIIIGWIAVEKPKNASGLILHYLYVKQAFKGWGIARELIGAALPSRPVMVTHLTERADRIMYAKSKEFEEFYLTPHII